MNFTLFFTGKRRLYTRAEHAAALMDLCLQRGIVYDRFCWEEDGGISLEVSLTAAKRLEQLCVERGIAVRLFGRSGLPYLFWRYRRRVGLAVGAVLGVILLILSTRFVWEVRVTGNEQVERGEILAELEACGLFVGSYIPHLHTEALETQVLIASDRLSWVAIHLDGTVAVVQVLEHTAPPDGEHRKPANLIAAVDGQIESIELYRGNCMVKVGQAVRAGELLVSGLYDSATQGYRYTRAAGTVKARTEHTFRVEIPLTREEKCYEEAEYSEIGLKFFHFSVKFFKKGGNDDLLCDIIKEDKAVELFDRYRLPVSLLVTKVHPYRLQSVRLTPDEALDAAYAALEEQLSALSTEAQLLKKDVRYAMDGDVLILTCRVECIENIAVQQEFEINE